MTARRRAPFGVLLLAALLLAAVVGVGASILFERAVRAPPSAASVAPAPPPPAPAPPPAVPEPIPATTVVGIEGAVEQAERGGSWRPVQLGDRLEVEGALRTGEGGRADLAVGERSRITVAPRSQVAVREVSAAVQRLRLTRGRIAVEHRGGERLLRVEAEDGTAVETRDARFSALAGGHGLAVAAVEGQVNLSAAGKAVVVSAGEEAVARTGKPPSEPRPIPAALLLKVARAAGGDGACARLRGSASPGAEVAVDGRLVALGEEGRFEALVPGQPGKREALVTVRDAAGRLEERRFRCEAAPGITDLKVRWKRAAAN